MRQKNSSVDCDVIRRFGAATIYEAQGRQGAVDPSIKPLSSAWRIAGPAFTVETSPDDNLIIHYAVSRGQPGDILVVDARGSIETALWGDILSLAARTAGIAGLVIDGAVRDAEAILKLGFPVFARGISIRGPEKRMPGRVNERVCFGGVLVEPGDIVVGDRDGVVVVQRASLERVAEAARQREIRDAELRTGIEAGYSTLELLNLTARIDPVTHLDV